MSTPPSCSGVRTTVPFPPGWEAAGSAGDPSVGAATQRPFPPGWAEAVTARRGGPTAPNAFTKAPPSAATPEEFGRPGFPSGWREAGGIPYRARLLGSDDPMSGTPRTPAERGSVVHPPNSRSHRRSGTGGGLAPSAADQTAMWDRTGQIAYGVFFDWCTGQPAFGVPDLWTPPWDEGHVFGQGENQRDFGACAAGCDAMSPPTGGWSRLSVQARADTLCNEAALAAGWTCGYAKNISTRLWGDGCTVECEYGRSLPCQFAAARRQSRLAAACDGCPTSTFQAFAHSKCQSSAQALTSAWCQPDANADGTVDCHCFVSCDGGIPAQVEFCG